MPSPTDFPAKGRVIDVRDTLVVFQPAGTAYELHLQTVSPYTGPTDQIIECFIRVKARKVYTVPSGGNFVTPIQGTPRIIQGRVQFVDNTTVVVHAVVPMIVELPLADTQIELSEGRITTGHMLNVVMLPGAAMEVIQTALA